MPIKQKNKPLSEEYATVDELLYDSFAHLYAYLDIKHDKQMQMFFGSSIRKTIRSFEREIRTDINMFMMDNCPELVEKNKKTDESADYMLRTKTSIEFKNVVEKD